MDPVRFGQVFGIDVPARTGHGATELNLTAIHVDRRNADLVLTGDDQVLHFEFQRRADPTMADRMLIYRSLLRVEPDYADKKIHQHVIVLGEGTSPSRIDEPPDLYFEFETHYARDLDPEEALSDPVKAPWSMLAPVGDGESHGQRLVKVMHIVTSVEPGFRAQDLVNTTLTFASVVMKREDIERALREANMSQDSISELTWAEEFVEEGRTKGLAESAHTNTVKNLEHRGLNRRQAELIAKALLEADSETSVQRAAFDDLDQLKALAGRDA
ncbi:hypothetical protein [Actinoplanes couchii]|uniref:Rpn family recombination-promoting nuclease/putative transposase n=1 Tax=Actinoplanes couchii TaxID=403638 RepID=A0ABQ3XQ64_9ACTN|nr:hypothetical protein [Actinoplanes couchii]MDR6323825.1 hypothetical protein [Actinoplanes couchii]GID60540.1 hypothetical protein Aco03nite_089440 [Actinoplanes couchii]